MSVSAPFLGRPLLARNLLRAGTGFCLILMVTASIGLAGTVSPPYQIGTWAGFRPAAITFTFDDDLPNQYAIAVPMFNAKGFKLTLFTVTTWLPGGAWAPVQTAALAGHEIASHTVTHSNLSTLSATLVTNELKNSQAAIDANVTIQKCTTLAYPYCVPPANGAIVPAFYIAARGCSGQLVPATPGDFINISSFVCGSEGLLQFADIKSKADAAEAANSWCVYLIHAIDNDNGYSPLPSATLQASINYLSTNQNKFWVETFGNVVRYIRERNGASVTETSSTNDSITVQVTDNLDDTIYNHPITLRRPLPANWPGAAVSQNNKAVPAQTVILNSTNYVMFDVVPDAGEVIISKVVQASILSKPVLASPSNFAFRLDGQVGARYAIYSSSDLLNWSPTQTNRLLGGYTNLTVAAPPTLQFYRAQWVP